MGLMAVLASDFGFALLRLVLIPYPRSLCKYTEPHASEGDIDIEASLA